ncbi:unnamed protein product, partial [Ixodes pacificus]
TTSVARASSCARGGARWLADQSQVTKLTLNFTLWHWYQIVAMMKRWRRRSQPLFSQVVHNVWTLVLVAWVAGSLKRSLSDALRARGQHAAPLMLDNPDALDFFSPDGRCLVRLLSTSLGYGVVLYQLTVPYSLAVRSTKPPADYGPCGPRYC